jgi:hypothetical protein
MQNRVTAKPMRAARTSSGVQPITPGTKLPARDASRNPTMNQGRGSRSREADTPVAGKKRAAMSVTGTIHSTRESFTTVPVRRASAP